jgi:hypothetical protein
VPWSERLARNTISSPGNRDRRSPVRILKDLPGALLSRGWVNHVQGVQEHRQIIPVIGLKLQSMLDKQQSRFWVAGIQPNRAAQKAHERGGSVLIQPA